MQDFHWYQRGRALELVHYGYDAADNRRIRQNLHPQAQQQNRDELYQYDRLLRLTRFQRGKLTTPLSLGGMAPPSMESNTETARQS